MDCKKMKEDQFFKNFKPISFFRKKNHTTEYNKDSWTHSYFYHILQLKSIVDDRIKQDFPDSGLDLEEFIDFLYHTSSGKVSPYLDDLPEDVQNMYFSYLINRNRTTS